MKLGYLINPAIIAVVVVSCVPVISSSDTEYLQSRIDVATQKKTSSFVLNSGEVTQAKRVSVPKNALWLTESLEVEYQNAPASLVITKIADKHPVKMTFLPKVDTRVSKTDTAVTVQDHLNAVCSQANWAYSVSEGVVLITDIETKTFFLTTQPGKNEATVRLRNLGSNNAASSAESAENTLNVELDPYQNEVISLLEVVLGLRAATDIEVTQDAPDENKNQPIDPRTRIAILPSANAIIVTASPHLMRAVESALADYQAATAKTVVLRITFFEVDTSKTANRQISLNLIRTAAHSLGIKILPSSRAAANSAISLNFTNGSLKQSEAVLQWLNTAGETAITFEDSLEVRNNAVASVDVTRTRQYIRSIKRAIRSSGATSLEEPSIEFDQLRTGWSIHIQPTIVDDLITIRMGLSRSNYVTEVPYSFNQGQISGTNFITDDYHRMMSVSMQHGETKLLTSLHNTESRSSRQRRPWLPLLGDGVSKNRRNRQTVMMMSASIL